MSTLPPSLLLRDDMIAPSVSATGTFTQVEYVNAPPEALLSEVPELKLIELDVPLVDTPDAI